MEFTVSDEADAREVVGDVVARARAAQSIADRWTQGQADEAAVAAGWAIVEPARNRALAERAVRDTGLGNVADKIAKNRRKTMGLLRDLQGARRSASFSTTGARPDRDRASRRRRRSDHAVDQSGRHAGEQHHQRAEGSQRDRRSRRRRRASRRSRCCWSSSTRSSTASARRATSCQQLPAPVTREQTFELMRQADLVVATGSATNVRAAY